MYIHSSYLWEPGIIKPCIFFRQGRSGYTVYTANSNPLWISKYLEHILLSKLCKSCGGFFLPIIALNQFLRATNIIYWNWKQIMSVSQFLKCARRGTLFWNKSKCSKSKIPSFFFLKVSFFQKILSCLSDRQYLQTFYCSWIFFST